LFFGLQPPAGGRKEGGSGGAGRPLLWGVYRQSALLAGGKGKKGKKKNEASRVITIALPQNEELGGRVLAIVPKSPPGEKGKKKG